MDGGSRTPGGGFAPGRTAGSALLMNPREAELVVRALLENPALVDVYFKEKRWAALAALVRFARRDVPTSLAQTDPALYRRLREQVTRFFLLGGDAFSLEKLEAKQDLARRTRSGQRKESSPSPRPTSNRCPKTSNIER
jgi:hypothetical protein